MKMCQMLSWNACTTWHCTLASLSSVPTFTSNPASCQWIFHRAADDDSSSWVHTTHVGDQSGFLGLAWA